MAAFSDILNEPVVRKEASIESGGRVYRFGADDPAAIAAGLIMSDASEVVRLSEHLTKVVGKAVEPAKVGNVKTILAAWEDCGPINEDVGSRAARANAKTDETELARLIYRKPELFLALYRCANEVLNVDGDLLTYALLGIRPVVAENAAPNPLVVAGLGESEGGDGTSPN